MVITDHGTSTLILRKYTSSPVSPQQRLKDPVICYDDPLAPVGEGDWEVMA